MREADIPPDAKVKALNDLRFKPRPKGGRIQLVLQQRHHVESAKTAFFLWRDVPTVPADEPD